MTEEGTNEWEMARAEERKQWRGLPEDFRAAISNGRILQTLTWEGREW